MGLVTGIETNRKIVTIYIDNVAFLRLHERYFKQLPVWEGDDVDEEAYIGSLCAKQSKPCYEAALYMLDARDMTSSMLVQGLTRKGFMKEVAESVCSRLIENGLINDERYAERYVELRKNSQNGVMAIERKLRSRGVDRDTAKQALEQIDEVSQLRSACELAVKLVRKYEGLPIREKKAKLSAAIARRGYTWDIVSEAVEKAVSEDDWDE